MVAETTIDITSAMNRGSVGAALNTRDVTLPTLIGQCSQADAAVLSEIIRAMQFSDMVQQLLESSDGALSRVVDFLAQARRTAPRQTEHRCCEDRMGSWTDQLSAFKTATCTLVPGPVEQENLSSGDIELF